MSSLGLLALVTILYTLPLNLADCVPKAPGVFSLIPLPALHKTYCGVEVFYHTDLPIPQVRVGTLPLVTTVDSVKGRVLALSPVPFPAREVEVLGSVCPLQVALLAPSTPADTPERMDPREGRLWCFLDSLPSGFSLHCADPPVPDHFWPGAVAGGCTFSLGGDLCLEARAHPVAVLQYRVLTGDGTGTLSWRTEHQSWGSWHWRVNTRGEWHQFVIPLYQHPMWRGVVDSLVLAPLDHRAPLQMGSIFFPRVPPVWGALLTDEAARWGAVTLGAGLVVVGLFLVRRRLACPCHPAVPAAVMAMAALLVLPFGDLHPAIRLGGAQIPWYVVVLALSACSLWPTGTLALATMACVTLTLVHGAVVAEGSGLSTAMTLSTGPLAFLVGLGWGRRGLGQSSRRATTFLAAGACLYALICAVPSRDPLYGALLRSVGRAYWDETVFGRTASLFVHPLVLASVALVVGTTAVLTPAVGRPTRAAGAIALLAGLGSLSRAYLAMTLFVLSARMRFRVALAAVAVAVAVVVATSHDPVQGLSRGFQLTRRWEGLRVTARVLAHKPLQGMGWGRYRRAVARYGSAWARATRATTPDNSYARLLAEGGLVGGGVWLSWVGVLLASAWRRGRVGPGPVALAMAAMWAVYDALYWPAAAALPLAAVGVWLGDTR